MKTELTQQELNFYNALCENRKIHKNKLSNDYYLNILFTGTPIKDKSYKEIDFIFELEPKRKFIDDSILLFDAMNCIYIGKIRDFFWMITEYENIIFISKSMIDITNKILSENCGLIIDDNIENFYYINQVQLENGDFKEYLEGYKKFAKQYGYDFELMKDIDDYPSVEEDVVEFNQLLKEYGIENYSDD